MLRDALHGVRGHLIKGVCIADDQGTLASSVFKRPAAYDG